MPGVLGNLTPWWGLTTEAAVAHYVASVTKPGYPRPEDIDRKIRLKFLQLQCDDQVLGHIRLLVSETTRDLDGALSDATHVARIGYWLGAQGFDVLLTRPLQDLTKETTWPARIRQGMAFPPPAPNPAPINSSSNAKPKKLRIPVAVTRQTCEEMLTVVKKLVDIEWGIHCHRVVGAPSAPSVSMAWANVHPKPARRDPKTIDPKAIEAVKAHAHTHGNTAFERMRNEAMLEAKIATNYRVPDLEKLHWPCFKPMKAGGTRIVPAVSGVDKKAKPRRIGATPAIDRYKALTQAKAYDDAFLVHEDGTAMTRDEIKAILKRMGHIDGYDAIPPHAWKHADLAQRAVAGVMRAQVKQAGHHGPGDATTRYVNPASPAIYTALTPVWRIPANAFGDCCRVCGELDFVVSELCIEHRLAGDDIVTAREEMDYELGMAALEGLTQLSDAVKRQLLEARGPTDD